MAAVNQEIHKMKIYIFADMEGISGICGSQMVSTAEGGSEYQRGRKYLTAEVNNCIKACFDAGADEVVLRDGHGCGYNVIWEDIEYDVELVQGYTCDIRFAGIEGADGVILLGYHAMGGTINAHLEHTFSSKAIQHMWINGKQVGEFAIDAAIAGEKGIPVIMTSGCDKLCAEARSFYPEVVTCQVKKSMGCQSVIMLSPQAARKQIYDKTCEAIQKLKEGKIPPFQVSKPVTVRKEFVSRMEPSRNLVAPRTVEATDDSIEVAFFNAR